MRLLCDALVEDDLSLSWYKQLNAQVVLLVRYNYDLWLSISTVDLSYIFFDGYHAP
jgi:hypothetical protein